MDKKDKGTLLSSLRRSILTALPRRCTGAWHYLLLFGLTFVISFIFLRGGGVPSPGSVIHPGLSNRGVWSMSSVDKGAHDSTEGADTHKENVKQQEDDQETETESLKNECPPDAERQVILLTYGRSGSSLTHDIISKHPDVFTYYEPLHNLAKSFSQRQAQHLRETGRYLHLTDIKDYNMAAINMLEKLMTCEYSRLNRFATLNLHAPKFPCTKDLYYCVQSAMTSRAEESCLSQGEERCASRPYKFVKIIRMAVRTIAPLLERYPCLKVIYLVRDARGSYFSKEKMFKSHGGNVTFDAERFCARLRKDVNDIIRLKNKYPDRVMMTRFETIANYPVISSKRIYEFVGLDFTKKYALFVFNKTHSSNPGGGYNTNRANSAASCYKWRHSIPYRYVSAFDHFCSEPFFKLGYLPAASESDVRNMDHPLIFHKDHFS